MCSINKLYSLCNKSTFDKCISYLRIFFSFSCAFKKRNMGSLPWAVLVFSFSCAFRQKKRKKKSGRIKDESFLPLTLCSYPASPSKYSYPFCGFFGQFTLDVSYGPTSEFALWKWFLCIDYIWLMGFAPQLQFFFYMIRYLLEKCWTHSDFSS